MKHWFNVTLIRQLFQKNSEYQKMNRLWLGLPVVILALSLSACQKTNEEKAKENLNEATAQGKEAFQEFRKSMKSSLDAANNKIASLKEKASEATGEAKDQLNEQLEALEKQRDVAMEKLNKLGENFSEGWESMKEGTQNAMSELNDSVEEAWSKISKD